MDYPVIAEADGVKIQPEKMQVDKLYHCIFQDKVFLFYKDEQEILNCYEIEEKEIVDQVKRASSSDEVEIILQRYIEKQNLNY